MTHKKKSSLRKTQSSLRKTQSALQKTQSAAFCNKNKAAKPVQSHCAGGTAVSDSGLQASGDNRESEDLISKLETQVAELEEQIALLKENSGGHGQREHCDPQRAALPEAGSLKPEALSPRAQLAAPVITAVTSVGSHFLSVTWTSVANADGYLIQRSTGSAFTSNVQIMTVDSSVTSTIIGELGANTLYYFRVRAVASGTNTDSEFSPSKSARTGLSSNDETVTFLQNWLNEEQSLFQNFAVLLPQLENTNLNTADRMRLLGSGVRRYGFIEKVFEVSGDFPQFWPPFGDGRKELDVYLKEIDVLRNLLVWFRFASRIVQDLLLIAGDDAFQTAGKYYTLARDGARRRHPEAAQVFEMLRLFWKRPRRTSSSEEPTIPEVERDASALLHGRKDGEIMIKHESPTPVLRPNNAAGGVHEVIDNVHGAKCRVQ